MHEVVQYVFTSTVQNDPQFGCEGQVQKARVVIQSLVDTADERAVDFSLEDARSLAQTMYVYNATRDSGITSIGKIDNHSPEMVLQSMGTIGLVRNKNGDPVIGVVELDIAYEDMPEAEAEAA